MKNLFFFLLAVSLPAFGISQSNCSDLVIFPDNGKGGTALRPIEPEGLSVKLLNVEHTYVLISLSTADKAVCFEPGQPISFVFADGSEVSLTNDIDGDCSQAAMINLGGNHKKQEELDQLRNKLVTSIRFVSNAGQREAAFSPENQQMFKDVINCIAETI